MRCSGEADSFHHGTAASRTAAVMVALERFRLSNGRWPERLTELVPNTCANCRPTRTMDDRCATAARLTASMSIRGPDGIDNGGAIRVAPPAAGVVAPADIGFQLWDVAHRRKPPLAHFVGPPAPAANARR